MLTFDKIATPRDTLISVLVYLHQEATRYEREASTTVGRRSQIFAANALRQAADELALSNVMFARLPESLDARAARALADEADIRGPVNQAFARAGSSPFRRVPD